MYEYNTDQKFLRQIFEGIKVESFISTTGIDLGVRALFKKLKDSPNIYALGMDYKIIEVANCPISARPIMIIPSESHPNNLLNSIKFFSNSYISTASNDSEILLHPFQYDGSQSIVRIALNFFLVYDKRSQRWLMMKVVVP